MSRFPDKMPAFAAVAALALALALAPCASFAQVTPAQGSTPPDDTPTIKVGGTIFTDYTYTDRPLATDAAGHKIHASAFDVKRAYINVGGNISHRISFRITPDITRLLTSTKGLGSGESVTTSMDGSEAYRLKYAFGQFNLDDWLPKGTWVRFGVQQTPWVDFLEGAYRYRFHNPVFVDAEKYLSSSDFGISGHFNLPANYGDFHAGVYNGETYSKPEVNNGKAVEVRGTVRPLPMARTLRGLRLTAFYSADRYMMSAPRNRFDGSVTFEHKHLNAGMDYLTAQDQATPSAAKVDASGYSLWAVPRSSIGIEGLLRYDSLKPDKKVDGRKKRVVAGLAYWFKTQAAPVAAAVMADFEHVKYDAALARPDEKRIALHCMFNF